MIGAAIVAGLGVAGQLASGTMSARSRRAEFDEQIRATMMKRDQTLGIATANAAASGVEMGSLSTTNYLAALTGEFNREIDSMRKLRKTVATTDLIGAFAGGVSGAAGVLGQYKKSTGAF